MHNLRIRPSHKPVARHERYAEQRRAG